LFIATNLLATGQRRYAIKRSKPIRLFESVCEVEGSLAHQQRHRLGKEFP
jgi:hypothetical protein